MKSFNYTIKDAQGIHARPAGVLVKEAGRFKSDITIEKDGEKADAKRIFAVMGLGVKSGETITVNIEGEDEDKAASSLQGFLQNNL
ncbi:MAG: HPr family phosphocarrier protein [Ruminococcus sp.]|nr:HPr family phosphocarrier protein [Ruminococcus sp.]